MGVRTKTTRETHEKESIRPSSNTSSSNTNLVTSLMKSWKIYSASSASGSSVDLQLDKPNRNLDGNIEAMAKQTHSVRRTSSSSSYSPAKFKSPGGASIGGNSDSPRLGKRNRPHLQRTQTSESRNGGRYFRDLDEDWSAIIDDYNMPIPTLSNGQNAIMGSETPGLELSRVSTVSSNIVSQSNGLVTYPQLPELQKPDTSIIEESEDIEAHDQDFQDMQAALQRIHKFDLILKDKATINLRELRQISWNGIPQVHRPMVWKILIGYLPVNTKRQEALLKRKRQEYCDGLAHTFSERHTRDESTWHQIEIDIPRTNPNIKLYQYPSVQLSLQKILYLWAIRHPASGYVQGINDIVTPFYQTFLSDYLTESEVNKVEEMDPKSYLTSEQITDVEADTFWCLTKLLEQITDNYIHGQPGILKQVKHLGQLVKRIDVDLYRHFERESVEFIQFSFRWMNCLLMREFTMHNVIRMWDTYLSETSSDTASGICNNLHMPVTPTEPRVATFATPTTNAIMDSPSSGLVNYANVTEDNTRIKQSSLNEFHVFVCAAFLIKWSDHLCGLDFQGIITFLQNPPTKSWTETDIEMLLSEAYIWQSLYKDATSHWQ